MVVIIMRGTDKDQLRGVLDDGGSVRIVAVGEASVLAIAADYAG